MLYQIIAALCALISLKVYAESPDLYGGRPITAGELPVSVYIGNCTATIVGPEVLLTAGHCRGNGSDVSFSVNNTRYTGKCVRHPDYDRGGYTNNDWSLCKFAPKISLPVYAYISARTLKVGDMVTMQGYGAGSNGRLNVGDADIKTVNNQDYITKGRVYLGGGDSGGGLFAQVKDLKNGPFEIVGINSRGGGNTSLFNITGLERSQTWFKNYASTQRVDVCGVNKDCGGSDPEKCVQERQDVAEVKSFLVYVEEVLAQCLAN